VRKNRMKSDQSSIFVMKFCLPVLGIIGAIALFGERPPIMRIIFLFVIVMPCLFGLTLATIEVVGERIRYRRFFKWTELQLVEVQRAKAALPPFIGSVELGRFLPPWGKLYFVLDRYVANGLFGTARYPLIDGLNSEPIANEEQADQNKHFNTLLVSVVVGIVISIVSLHFGSGLSLQSPGSDPSWPTWMRLQFQIAALLHAVAVQIAGLVIFAIVALRHRNRTEAGIYGFLFGFALAFIVNRFLGKF
jgi:hypothetical protein